MKKSTAIFVCYYRYYVVGSNDVDVIGGQENMVLAPLGYEITVQPGDLIGFYLTDAILNYDTCSSLRTWLDSSSFPTDYTTLTMAAVGVDACRTYAVEAVVTPST